MSEGEGKESLKIKASDFHRGFDAWTDGQKVEVVSGDEDKPTVVTLTRGSNKVIGKVKMYPSDDPHKDRGY